MLDTACVNALELPEVAATWRYCRQYQEIYIFLIVGFPQNSNKRRTLSDRQIACHCPDRASSRVAGLEKVPISPWLVTLLHICGVYTNSAIACSDITGNSARAPISRHQAPMLPRRASMSPHRALMSPHRALISSHQMESVWAFCDVLQCFNPLTTTRTLVSSFKNVW